MILMGAEKSDGKEGQVFTDKANTLFLSLQRN